MAWMVKFRVPPFEVVVGAYPGDVVILRPQLYWEMRLTVVYHIAYHVAT